MCLFFNAGRGEKGEKVSALRPTRRVADPQEKTQDKKKGCCAL